MHHPSNVQPFQCPTMHQYAPPLQCITFSMHHNAPQCTKMHHSPNAPPFQCSSTPKHHDMRRCLGVEQFMGKEEGTSLHPSIPTEPSFEPFGAFEEVFSSYFYGFSFIFLFFLFFFSFQAFVFLFTFIYFYLFHQKLLAFSLFSYLCCCLQLFPHAPLYSLIYVL